MISIAIPTYEMKGHGIVFLRRCIDSISRQRISSMKDFEIIISDHSQTNEIEDFYNTLDFNIEVTYVRNQRMRGNISANVNNAISHCKGEYIKILFQDDMLVEENYLATLTGQVKTHTPDFIFTGAKHTNDGINFYDEMSPKPNPHILFGENTISSPSTLTIHRDIFKKIHFDENLKLLMDCDYYYNLFTRHPNHLLIPQIHIANGVWPGQTHSSMNGLTVIHEVKYLLLKYKNANIAQKLENYAQFLKPKDRFLANSLYQLAIDANYLYSPPSKLIRKLAFKAS